MPAINNKEVNLSFSQYALLRAEVLLAELSGNGLAEEELQIHFEGSFRKIYRTDVSKITSNPYQEGTADGGVEIRVNRDSLYDDLPEGVFHQPVAATGNTNVNGMIADSRRLKQEEKMARRFFAPFDQQLLLFSTTIEQEERRRLQHMEAGNLTNDPYAFWGLPPAIPYDMAVRLSAVLPWSYAIKGNQPLIASVLESILEKSVSVQTIRQPYQPAWQASRNMGHIRLGDDAVLGQAYEEETVVWAFTIHGISGTEMPAYVQGGAVNGLLEYVNDLFLPIEVDARFEFETEKKTAAAFTPILGYGFSL
jgi:hypothetical protein